MTWSTFFAVREDFTSLLECMLHFDGARIFEPNSRPGYPARQFSSAMEAVEALQLGVDPSGDGVAANCALWVPAVMPSPTRHRVALATGNWREFVQGCGLFWLHAGGVYAETITASRIGWFTQATARRQCTVEPRPERVHWVEHAQVIRELTRALRGLRAARAARFPILTGAAGLQRRGYRLLYLNREIAVGKV